MEFAFYRITLETISQSFERYFLGSKASVRANYKKSMFVQAEYFIY